MSNRPGHKLGYICYAVGVLCFCTALGLLIQNFVSENRLAERSGEIVREMRRLLPEITEGVADSHAGTRTPVMQIDGYDYSYLLEVPEYDKALPVQSLWEESRIAVSPALFYGSVSEGFLVIGGSGRRNQLGCLSRLEPDDLIFLTDMSGVRYAFTVEKIEKTEKLDFDYLSLEKQGLALFIKDEWGFQYTVVRCKATM